MSAKKIRQRPKKRRDFAAFVKFVNLNLRRIKAGQPVLMVVSVVDLRGNALTVQTLNGHPNPPPPLIRLLVEE